MINNNSGIMESVFRSSFLFIASKHLRPDIPEQIKELVDFLSDSEADKEKILSLNDELAKSKKDKEEIKRITGEMAKLIHLPEKYKDTFPAQK